MGYIGLDVIAGCVAVFLKLASHAPHKGFINLESNETAGPPRPIATRCLDGAHHRGYQASPPNSLRVGRLKCPSSAPRVTYNVAPHGRACPVGPLMKSHSRRYIN